MKKKTKWILLSISGFLLLLLIAQIYYSYVMSDTWTEEKAAVQAARQFGGLNAVDKTYRSVWDKDSIYWVIAGKDEEQKDLMVWVKFTEQKVPAGGKETVHAVPLDSGRSEAQMRAQIQQDLPGAEIHRLLPGMYQGEYVWQLHYELDHQTKYRFYRFSDGTPIGDDIVLPNQ